MAIRKITNRILTDSTVNATAIADGSIAAAKIAADAVTTAKIADSTVTIAKLSATGTKDSTTFLRGDGTFAVVSVTPTIRKWMPSFHLNPTLLGY